MSYRVTGPTRAISLLLRYCGILNAGSWFQTFGLFSISYMGCHPSHWLSYFSEGFETTNQNVKLLKRHENPWEQVIVHVDSFSLHLTRSVDGWLFRYYLANYIARLVQLTGWRFPSRVWTIVFDLFLFLDCWNYHQVNVPLYNCMPLLFAFMELRFPTTDSCLQLGPCPNLEPKHTKWRVDGERDV